LQKDETEPGLYACNKKKKNMTLKRKLYLLLFQLSFVLMKSQCPQVFDYLGNPQSQPYWISCTGAAYTLNFQSPSSWGTYTISWGDNSPDDVGASYVANAIVPHTYTATTDTFIVKLFIPSLTCTLTGVVVMEQAVNAFLSIPAGGTTAVCSPGVMSFSNVSTNVSKTTRFQWDFGDNTPLANFSFTNANMATSNLYSAANVTCQTNVTLKAWNYCSFSATSTAVLGPIFVYDKDVPAITTSASILCWPHSTFTFSNTSTLNCAAQGNNYQRKQYWYLGNVWTWNSNQDSIIPWTNIPPDAPQTVAFPFPGGFNVQLVDSNVCGTSTANAFVNVFNAPTASIVAPGPPLCQNTSITFTNASSFGAFYKYDFGEGAGYFTLPSGPQAHTYTNTGTYTVSLIAYLPFSGTCADTSSVVINILPSPTADFTHTPVAACGSLTNVTFTDTSIGALAWNWDFGNLNISSLQAPPSQSYSPSSVYTISLTVTAGNGCSSTKTNTVEVYPIPTAAFVATAVCVGSPATFSNQSTSMPSYPLLSFTWDFGDASPTSTVISPVYTYTNATVYSVTLTASNAVCTGTLVQNVTVNPKPVPDFVITPTAGCTPLAAGFVNTTPGTNTYLWKFGVGSASSTFTSPLFTYTTASTSNQTNTVTLIATSAFGCVDSVKKTIVQFANPTPSFTPSQASGCWPFNVTFANSSTGFNTSDWDFGNGLTSILMNPGTTYTNAAGSTATNIAVKLVVTSTNGCKDSTTKNVLLHARPFATFTADTPGCSPKIVTFTNLSTGATTYSWVFGSSGSSSAASPTFQFVNTSAVNQNSLTELVAINADGCTDTIKANVRIYPKPNILFTASVDSGCPLLRVNFPTVAGLTSYNWNLGNGVTATTASTSANYSNNTATTKSYTAQLIGMDANGCIDTATRIIKVFAEPTASFSATPDTLFLPEAEVILTNHSIGASTYSWLFGDGGTSTNALPSYSYITTGEFQIRLIARSTKGCRDTFDLANKIVVEDGSVFQIPNAFTPNTNGSPGTVFNSSDLSNDIFHPNLKGVIDYRFTIYSRWGEVMFDTKNVKEGWDGYYKGKLCDQDVYVWKIYIKMNNNQELKKAGDVTLIR